MNKSVKRIKDLGEQGLLKRIWRFCPADVVGDDGAVVAIAPGQLLVVTTDVLVDGVHFSDRTTSVEDIGWRAAAANLSDLAAMGATPLGITVGLSLNSDLPSVWVDRLYEGINSCLQRYHTSILGGDISRSDVITVGITAFGQVYPNRIIRRGVAQRGDAIIVTGYHGASKAGLELLLNPDFGQHLEDSLRQSLIIAHQKPKPRLDVLEQLWAISETTHVAGMDSSDGLADAVIQICRCSGVGAEIERNAVSSPKSLTQLVSPEVALEWALYGGEDFELVLCLPEEAALALVERLGRGAAAIGKITTGDEVKLVDSTGKHPQRLLNLASGFQHF